MTLSISDVLDVEYPGPPAWSGDGRRLAATVYEDDGRALVVADGDGGETWRFRPDAGFVTDLAWRPTGAECLVATDAPATLLLDTDAREARPLSTVDGAAHAWSNGGDRVACYRDGRPRVHDVETGAVTGFDAPERGPYLGESRAFAWSDDDGLLAYRFVDRETKQVGVLDVDSGELVWRTDGADSAHTPAWLADGRLLFERVGDHRTVREFVAADPRGGDETVLVREEEPELGVVSRGAPAVSPDGERVALALPFDGWDHLHLLDPATGDLTQLTAGAFEDKGVADSAPVWVDDDTLVFASNRRAPEERGIYALRLDAGSVQSLVETPGTNVHPAPSPDGDRLAYVHADRERSPELRVRSVGDAPDEAGDRVTTSVVDDWPADPLEPERVVLESADGEEVPAFRFDPRETDAVPDDATDLPAVVWVHGGPMRQMRDGWHPSRSYGLAYTVHQYLAREGYVGLVVNYRGGIGYGKAFRQGIAADPGREIDDDVAACAEYLADLEFVDGDALAVWGLSYGGYAALRVLGTVPDAFDLGVNLAGVADRRVYEEWATETKYPSAESSLPTTLGGTRWEAPDAWDAASPVTTMDRYEAPLYSFHGTADRYVNVEQLRVVVDRLLGTDAAFEAEFYPDESHVFAERRTWERTLGKLTEALETEL